MNDYTIFAVSAGKTIISHVTGSHCELCATSEALTEICTKLTLSPLDIFIVAVILGKHDNVLKPIHRPVIAEPAKEPPKLTFVPKDEKEN